MSGREGSEVLGVVLPGVFATAKDSLVSEDSLPPDGADDGAGEVEDVGVGPGVEPGTFLATGVEPAFLVAVSCLFFLSALYCLMAFRPVFLG